MDTLFTYLLLKEGIFLTSQPDHSSLQPAHFWIDPKYYTSPLYENIRLYYSHFNHRPELYVQERLGRRGIGVNSTAFDDGEDHQALDQLDAWRRQIIVTFASRVVPEWEDRKHDAVSRYDDEMQPDTGVSGRVVKTPKHAAAAGRFRWSNDEGMRSQIGSSDKATRSRTSFLSGFSDRLRPMSWLSFSSDAQLAALSKRWSSIMRSSDGSWRQELHLLGFRGSRASDELQFRLAVRSEVRSNATSDLLVLGGEMSRFSVTSF